jgi:hypothetical protein
VIDKNKKGCFYPIYDGSQFLERDDRLFLPYENVHYSHHLSYAGPSVLASGGVCNKL